MLRSKTETETEKETEVFYLVPVNVGREWSYFQIVGCQPARLFQTEYARFQMIKNVKNQFQILNACTQMLPLLGSAQCNGINIIIISTESSIL